MKLEPAFLAGLRCPQPLIRAKFFEVYDQSVRRRIFDRLLYIICSQNWEHIGQHFWIKQCLELLLVTCVSSKLYRPNLMVTLVVKSNFILMNRLERIYIFLYTRIFYQVLSYL